MNLDDENHEYLLTSRPEIWDVSLRDGSVMYVAVHAYCVEGDEAVFSVLCRGTPNFEIEALRIPLSVVPEDFD